MTTTTALRCLEDVPDGGRSVTFHKCGNKIKKDGLCGIHLRAREQAILRREKWKEESRLSDENRANANLLAQLLGAGRPYYSSEISGYTGGLVLSKDQVTKLLARLDAAERD